MASLATTQDLIDEVRSLINELNQDSVQDERDILPALNRAQDQMMAVLSKHYPDPYLETAEVTIRGDEDGLYKIPENAWSDAVTKVEMEQQQGGNNARYEVSRASYRHVSQYRSSGRPNVPYYYIVKGRDIELIPPPNSSYKMIMWYLRKPEKLVLPQGRITLVDADSNRINITDIGTQLSTEVGELQNFVNIVDGQTGVIKATAQIKSINGSTIIFKSIPSQNTILNRTVTTDLTTVTDRSDTLDIHPNDYICSVEGGCVPYFFQPGRNFILSHAAADVGRAIGLPSESMYREREKFEDEISSTWASRESHLRIKQKSPHWMRRLRIKGHRG